MDYNIFRLMIFDTGAAPKTLDDFFKWFGTLNWKEKDAIDLEIRTPALNSWYGEIIKIFPPATGKALLETPQLCQAHYTACGEALQLFCAEPFAEKAWRVARKLAEKHGLGFFDISYQEDVILPDLSVMGVAPRYELEIQIDIWDERDEYQRVIDAISAFPEKDPDLLLTLAIEYNNVKKYDEVVKTLMEIKAHMEGDPHWNYVLGYAYRYQGLFGEAVKYIEKAVYLSGGEYRFKDILAHCYYQIGQRALAEKTINEYLRARLNEIHEEHDDEGYKEIVESLVNEYTLECCNADHLACLAESCHKVAAYHLGQSNYAEARRYFEICLRARPDDETAKKYLAEIQ